MSTPHRPTIIITGGIVSGIGKGITAASIGRLLSDTGYQINMVKADPYLNQDAGTMNPFRHGEVFVTDDGAETDLDLGHYERFLDQDLDKRSCFTGGSVYTAVMEKEREGDFLGRDIQVIPHITDEIKRRFHLAASVTDQSSPDLLIAEIGGTVGDIEALSFIEAVRQYYLEDPANTLFVHVVKMDYLYPSDEGKTKPIQHSVGALRSFGIQPNILIVRCKRELTQDEREKLAMFTGVSPDSIIPAPNASSLYDIPRNFQRAGIIPAIQSHFPNCHPSRNTQNPWNQLYQDLQEQSGEVTIGLVGKYTDNDDAYLSVVEAIKHAGLFHHVHCRIVPIHSEGQIAEDMQTVDAIIVPGGFGSRGVEGKIEAIAIARATKKPFLGICLGLQMAVIEFARNQLGIEAHSTECDEHTSHPVVAILPDQLGIKKKGGTMRLGSYPALLRENSLVQKLYTTYRSTEIRENTVHERHRHRYEVNPAYHKQLAAAGLILSGVSPDGSLVEYIELPTTIHPYFVATQAHPEFRSRPHRPHPLFAGLIESCLQEKATSDQQAA
jgi:CTP synthase